MSAGEIANHTNDKYTAPLLVIVVWNLKAKLQSNQISYQKPAKRIPLHKNKLSISFTFEEKR